MPLLEVLATSVRCIGKILALLEEMRGAKMLKNEFIEMLELMEWPIRQMQKHLKSEQAQATTQDDGERIDHLQHLLTYSELAKFHKRRPNGTYVNLEASVRLNNNARNARTAPLALCNRNELNFTGAPESPLLETIRQESLRGPPNLAMDLNLIAENLDHAIKLDVPLHQIAILREMGMPLGGTKPAEATKPSIGIPRPVILKQQLQTPQTPNLLSQPPVLPTIHNTNFNLTKPLVNNASSQTFPSQLAVPSVHANNSSSQLCMPPLAIPNPPANHSLPRAPMPLPAVPNIPSNNLLYRQFIPSSTIPNPPTNNPLPQTSVPLPTIPNPSTGNLLSRTFVSSLPANPRSVLPTTPYPYPTVPNAQQRPFWPPRIPQTRSRQ
ncbi:hypothetical protein B7463_g5703, partial [Scytalidium lignicola]